VPDQAGGSPASGVHRGARQVLACRRRCGDGAGADLPAASFRTMSA